MSALLTVLMSVYNGEEYLDEAIESILNQTYEDFQFLIIDDASTDRSPRMLQKWANHDDRIRLMLNEHNQGLGAVLAQGMRDADTPLVARMDADDVAHPERLQRQVEYMKANPEVGVLGTFAVDVDEHGQIVKPRRFPVTHEEICQLLWTNPILHPTVMMRRREILAAGNYDPDLRKRQDYDLWFRCAEAGLRFANLPEPLLEYRFTDDYYRRNDLGVAWLQAKIGWRGCRRTNAPWIAYIGVAVPFLRALLPRPLNALVHRILERVDPRRSPQAADQTASAS
jgi:glycosyltransferase involved in cell wall biosynthesis